MNPNNFQMNQMYVEELQRALAMERLAQQISGEESALAAYLNAHLLTPLGRKLIRGGQVLLDMSEGAPKSEQIAYRAS